MNASERSAAWVKDQRDPNNWIQIPEFGINPQEEVVDGIAYPFDGFALPIVVPSPKDYELRRIMRAQVKTARGLIQQTHSSLKDARANWTQVIDLQVLDESARLNINPEQRAAAMYFLVMESTRTADRLTNRRGPGVMRMCQEAIASSAEILSEWTLMKSSGETLAFNAAMNQFKREASARGRSAALALHHKAGGSIEKRQLIQYAWASGKYTSRDICAEQECAALNMSFSTARKALRGCPDPT